MTSQIPAASPLHPYRNISAVPASGRVGVGATSPDPTSAASPVGSALLWTFGIGALAVIGYSLVARAPEPAPASIRPTRQGRRPNPVYPTRRGHLDDPLEDEMVVCVYGDGAVYGGKIRGGWDPHYWLTLRLEHEPYALYEAYEVPRQLALDIEAQGTSDQVFSDGYTAMRAIARYLAKEPFYEYEG